MSRYFITRTDTGQILRTDYRPSRGMLHSRNWTDRPVTDRIDGPAPWRGSEQDACDLIRRVCTAEEFGVLAVEAVGDE